MLTYFQEYYLGLARGISYVPTQIATICAVCFLLNDTEWTIKGILRKLGECILFFTATVLATSAVYMLLGDNQLDRWLLALCIAIYAVCFSKYKPRVRLVRSITYFAAYMVIFSISEPLGILFRMIDERYWNWSQHLTWLTVVLLIVGIVCFLRHFASKKGSIVHPQFVTLLCVVSLMIIVSQIAYLNLSGQTDFSLIDTNYKQYNLVVSLFLLIIEMLTYYLYYSVVTVTQQNETLLTMRHKAEMEEEKFQANRVNYDDLRMLRHELKNHSFYMRSLLDAKKYDELREYLSHTADSELDKLQSFDCGNYTVDVVINHAVNEARQRGVEVKTKIIVPRKMPFDDNDMCSLLSNLMENAIEAAMQSGLPQPSVEISILPRQDYLFIRVTNDMNHNLSDQQRLSLKTTKHQHNLHGYGTRVIRSVAEKYRGTVHFDVADGRFVVDVMLELPREAVEEETA